jgi:hypothetical protein
MGSSLFSKCHCLLPALASTYLAAGTCDGVSSFPVAVFMVVALATPPLGLFMELAFFDVEGGVMGAPQSVRHVSLEVWCVVLVLSPAHDGVLRSLSISWGSWFAHMFLLSALVDLERVAAAMVCL